MKSIAVAPHTALLWGAALALAAACGHTSSGDPAGGPASEATAAAVTGEDLRRNSALALDQVLMARVPALHVTRRSNGSLSFRIRGTSSVIGSNEPLVVLDGMVTDPAALDAFAHINPNDIHRVEVLRGPAETSMYGLRGANGVIVITTRVSNDE
jgi:TonB-dependent starch-binding outer membrane protein SusC